MGTNYSTESLMDEAEVVDVVDENGVVISQATRNEVYEKGLLHPAVNIILINQKGQIYIQQRSAKKSAFPLYWDISAAEHLKSGENYQEGAYRGLREELSIKTPLKLLRPKHIQKSQFVKKGQLIKEYELVELYGGVWSQNIQFDPEEISAGKFVLLKELKEMLENNNDRFTPWGMDELGYIIRKPHLIAGLTH